MRIVSCQPAATHVSTERRRVHILHRQEKILRLLRPSTRRMTCLCAGCTTHIPEIEPAPFSVTFCRDWQCALCVIAILCNYSLSIDFPATPSCISARGLLSLVPMYVAITFTYFRVPRAFSGSNGGRRADC